ncbi:MAG: hypothetical protein PVJ89_01170 [Planctomycetota bacterium]|jgi:hypothetical protein
MSRVILKSQQVQQQDTAEIRRAAAIARGAQPEVRLLEVGGVVRGLEVRCACGELVTVELQVPPAAADPGGAA